MKLQISEARVRVLERELAAAASACQASLEQCQSATGGSPAGAQVPGTSLTGYETPKYRLPWTDDQRETSLEAMARVHPGELLTL